MASPEEAHRRAPQTTPARGSPTPREQVWPLGGAAGRAMKMSAAPHLPSQGNLAAPGSSWSGRVYFHFNYNET